MSNLFTTCVLYVGVLYISVNKYEVPSRNAVAKKYSCCHESSPQKCCSLFWFKYFNILTSRIRQVQNTVCSLKKSTIQGLLELILFNCELFFLVDLWQLLPAFPEVNIGKVWEYFVRIITVFRNSMQRAFSHNTKLWRCLVNTVGFCGLH